MFAVNPPVNLVAPVTVPPVKGVLPPPPNEDALLYLISPVPFLTKTSVKVSSLFNDVVKYKVGIYTELDAVAVTLLPPKITVLSALGFIVFLSPPIITELSESFIVFELPPPINELTELSAIECPAPPIIPLRIALNV